MLIIQQLVYCEVLDIVEVLDGGVLRYGTFLFFLNLFLLTYAIQLIIIVISIVGLLVPCPGLLFLGPL